MLLLNIVQLYRPRIHLFAHGDFRRPFPLAFTVALHTSFLPTFPACLRGHHTCHGAEELTLISSPTTVATATHAKVATAPSSATHAFRIQHHADAAHEVT